MIPVEPSVLSARWTKYRRPLDHARERCVCCGTVISDGRLVYVRADGLELYACWMLRSLSTSGRAGRESVPLERVRGTGDVRQTPHRSARPSIAGPLVPGRFRRFLRFLTRKDVP